MGDKEIPRRTLLSTALGVLALSASCSDRVPADSGLNGEGIPAGYPNGGTTGVRGPLEKVVDPPVFRVPGQVVENIDFEARRVEVAAPDVQFRNCRFVYSGAVDESFSLISLYDSATGVGFVNCEADGRDQVERTLQGKSGVRVEACRFHHTANAVEIETAFSVRRCYFHDIASPAGTDWHADGIQARDGDVDDVLIVDNTIFLTGPESGAVRVFGRDNTYLRNVDVSRNLMAGGGFTVYVGAASTENVTVNDNVFTRRFFPEVGRYGIWYPDGGGFIASGNRILETGEGTSPES